MLFEVLDVESSTVTLMSISSIAGHEISVWFIEYLLAPVVCEVISLEIIQEHEIFDIINIGNLSTLVHRFSEIKALGCSMGDNFSPSSMSPSSRVYIVIAFNIEAEIPLSLNHFVIGALISIIFFSVFYVTFDITATAWNAEIKEVWKNRHRKEHL